MLQREPLQTGELAIGHAAAPAGVDHVSAGCGHATGERVAILRGAVAVTHGSHIVVEPAGWDVVDGVIDSGPWFAVAVEEWTGSMRGLGKGGKGFTRAGR